MVAQNMLDSYARQILYVRIELIRNMNINYSATMAEWSRNIDIRYIDKYLLDMFEGYIVIDM